MNRTIYVADQLCGYCAFVFAYSKSSFSHDAACIVQEDEIQTYFKQYDILNIYQH